jgi:hypothetical protein
MVNLHKFSMRRNRRASRRWVVATLTIALLALPMAVTPYKAHAQCQNYHASAYSTISSIISSVYASASFDSGGHRTISLIFTLNSAHAKTDCGFVNCDGDGDRVMELNFTSPNICIIAEFDCNQLRLDVSPCNQNNNACVYFKVFYQEDWTPGTTNNPRKKTGYIFLPPSIWTSTTTTNLTSNLSDSPC